MFTPLCWAVTVSFEKVDSAISDADMILLESDLRARVNPFMEALMETPLFQELPAGKAGMAFPAGKNTIAGYSDANCLLDRVEEFLASNA